MTTGSSKRTQLFRRQQALLEACFNDFQKAFPNENACWKELFRQCLDAGIVYCHRCGDANVEYHHGRKMICRKCRKTSSFTAGTFFKGIRKPAPWLCAIWFKERGTPVSINKLALFVRGAYSSAWGRTRKLEAVILSEMGEDAQEVDSSLFQKLFGKRSRETPARTHPQGEQDEVEKSLCQSEHDNADNQMNEPFDTEAPSPESSRTAPGKAFGDEFSDFLGEQEIKIFDLLSDQPISFDTMHHLTGIAPGTISGALALLELAGLTRSTSIDRYVRSTPIARFEAQTKRTSSLTLSGGGQAKMIDTVNDIIDFVCNNFQMVSRKYFQYLAAAYWCNKNRRRWGSGALMAACLRSPPIDIKDILAFVSPPSIKISA